LIDRRVLLGGTLAMLFPSSLTGQTQATRKPYRVGFLGLGAPYWKESALVESFREGLREQGFNERDNLVIEYRWGHDDPGRLPSLAKELADLPVDVIFAAGGNITAVAAQHATRSIPIVMEGASDPVGSGLIRSFARPSGNMTGLANLNIEVGPKLLEMMSAVRPQVTVVTVLRHSSQPGTGQSLEAVERAARAMHIDVRALAYETFADIEKGIATSRRIGGVVILGGPRPYTWAKRLASLTLQSRLPAISPHREFAEAGGLMSYGQNKNAEFRTAAVYVSKILRGVRPEDLPVEEVARFELIVNLKSAKAIGVTIPQSLMARADQIIE
jgi:putative tryptophan/tyrosine transport system substrate-binding protein